ncbi:MAG: rRNA-processing protein las1 [Geoglossum simile]|nr:MAG: rRNA-processing protein las1 [Geoglossum simile]
MPRAKLVLWRHHDDLLDVRSAFYPSPGGQDRRRDAVMTVRVWSVRGKVPHLIDSTSLLTEAVLNDVPGVSQRVVCLAYSAAFCRFVTGLTDVALKGAFHKTMYKAAKNLGLPTALVELRHAATHRQLLSLPVLRKTAQRSLEWLWSNYWVKIDGSKSHETGTGASDPFDIEECKYQLRSVLQLYRRSRRMQIRQHLLPAEDEIPATSQIIRDCCNGVVDRVFILVGVLLEPGFILQNRQRLRSGKTLNDNVSLWDDLLRALSNPAIPTFLPALLNGLLDCICEQSTKSIRNIAQKDSAFHWISHILSSQEWRGEEAIVGLDLESTLQRCFMNPNDWTLKVASLLLSISDTLKRNYDELACFTQIQLETDPHFQGCPLEGQHDAEQIERAETQLIAAIQKEIGDNEARYLGLLDQDPYEYTLEESLDVVSLASRGSSDEEDREGEKGEGGEEAKQAPMLASTSSATKGWKKYEGDWIPKPIGVV